MPIYSFLKKQHTTPALSEIGSHLNNSRLVLEIIKKFCLESSNNNLFQKHPELSDIEQRILTLLSILALRDSPDELKKYTLSCISDLPNLVFALEIINKKIRTQNCD